LQLFHLLFQSFAGLDLRVGIGCAERKLGRAKHCRTDNQKRL